MSMGDIDARLSEIRSLRTKFDAVCSRIDELTDEDGLSPSGLPVIDECIEGIESLIKWYEPHKPDDLPDSGNAHHVRYIMRAIDGVCDWAMSFISRDFADEMQKQLTHIDKMAYELDMTVINAYIVDRSEHSIRFKRCELPDDVYFDIEERLARFTDELYQLAIRLRRLRKWAAQAIEQQQVTVLRTNEAEEPETQEVITDEQELPPGIKKSVRRTLVTRL